MDHSAIPVSQNLGVISQYLQDSGRICAAKLLELTGPENLVFTSSDPQSLEAYVDRGVEVRTADFSKPQGLSETFAGVDTAVLVSMPFVGPRRRAAHKAAVDAAVAAGVKKLVYTSSVGADAEDIDSYEVKDYIWNRIAAVIESQEQRKGCERVAHHPGCARAVRHHGAVRIGIRRIRYGSYQLHGID